MKTRPLLTAKPPSIRIVWFVLIVALATMAGMVCEWRAPGLARYAQDSLMRARGTLIVPDDIVIIAIDEKSINRLGQFPWKRDLTARVLNTISTVQPKAIALDVLYSEPTDAEDDKSLAEAIERAGNVILGEQLIEKRESNEPEQSAWLNLLPEFVNAAAATGHVHVPVEHDGTARDLILRLADDEAAAKWALAVETVRVGDRLDAGEIVETGESVRIGKRRLPFTSAAERDFPLELKDAAGRFDVFQPMRMTIDYVGATNSFAAQTYSFADVLDGRVSPEKFRGKYVLIGATAATLGDRIATPFVHSEDDSGSQNGELMPGVEILANSINTILRERFYTGVSDWTAGLCAALVASIVLLLIRLAEGKFEAAKQIVSLAGFGALILIGSFAVYNYFLVIPPVVPMIVSLAAAAPLALMRRSLAASAGIDARISELLAIEKNILTGGARHFENSAEFGSNLASSKITSILSRGLEWKTQKLERLSRDLIERSSFVDRSLRSLDEGLLISEPDGSITFANSRAAEILNLPEQRLIGSNLFTRIGEAAGNHDKAEIFSEETITRQLLDRSSFKQEIVIGDSAHFLLRLSAVTSPSDDGEIIGIVATLSDITQHHELQQIKNDVITLVTHELRTPLTAIQGMSEVLSEHEVEPETRRKMLTTINDEAKRLARMIDEYLDITRLESGIQKARFSSVNILELIERALLILDALAAQKEIEIERRFELGLPPIPADAGMLAQAITNIVGNAVKYSSPKTKITVEIQTNLNRLQISVADEGYGISPEQLPHIFEKFYRIPHRQTTDISGTGLGLALTREIVELHGGRIAVESKLNVGSTFTVYLPISKEKLK